MLQHRVASPSFMHRIGVGLKRGKLQLQSARPTRLTGRSLSADIICPWPRSTAWFPPPSCEVQPPHSLRWRSRPLPDKQPIAPQYRRSAARAPDRRGGQRKSVGVRRRYERTLIMAHYGEPNRLPHWIGRLLCWLDFHDYRLIEMVGSFGEAGRVQKVECRRCGKVTTRTGEM